MCVYQHHILVYRNFIDKYYYYCQYYYCNLLLLQFLINTQGENSNENESVSEEMEVDNTFNADHNYEGN